MSWRTPFTSFRVATDDSTDHIPSCKHIFHAAGFWVQGLGFRVQWSEKEKLHLILSFCAPWPCLLWQVGLSFAVKIRRWRYLDCWLQFGNLPIPFWICSCGSSWFEKQAQLKDRICVNLLPAELLCYKFSTLSYLLSCETFFFQWTIRVNCFLYNYFLWTCFQWTRRALVMNGKREAATVMRDTVVYIASHV
jgi:hypothetical protein